MGMLSAAGDDFLAQLEVLPNTVGERCTGDLEKSLPGLGRDTFAYSLKQCHHWWGSPPTMNGRGLYRGSVIEKARYMKALRQSKAREEQASMQRAEAASSSPCQQYNSHLPLLFTVRKPHWPWSLCNRKQIGLTC